MSLVDDLSGVSDQVPDSIQQYLMFCIIAVDLLALLRKFLNHHCHLRGQLSIFNLQCVHLWPVCLLGRFPENVSGPAVVQHLAYAPGDVLQPKILILKVGQLLPDSLEGGFRILEGGQVDVPLVWFPTWAYLISGLRSSLLPWIGGGCGRGRLEDGGVTQQLLFLASVGSISGPSL